MSRIDGFFFTDKKGRVRRTGRYYEDRKWRVVSDVVREVPIPVEAGPLYEGTKVYVMPSGKKRAGRRLKGEERLAQSYLVGSQDMAFYIPEEEGGQVPLHSEYVGPSEMEQETTFFTTIRNEETGALDRVPTKTQIVNGKVRWTRGEPIPGPVMVDGEWFGPVDSAKWEDFPDPLPNNPAHTKPVLVGPDFVMEGVVTPAWEIQGEPMHKTPMIYGPKGRTPEELDTIVSPDLENEMFRQAVEEKHSQLSSGQITGKDWDEFRSAIHNNPDSILSALPPDLQSKIAEQKRLKQDIMLITNEPEGWMLLPGEIRGKNLARSEVAGAVAVSPEYLGAYVPGTVGETTSGLVPATLPGMTPAPRMKKSSGSAKAVEQVPGTFVPISEKLRSADQDKREAVIEQAMRDMGVAEEEVPKKRRTTVAPRHKNMEESEYMYGTPSVWGPYQRNPEDVLEEVREGKITPAEARKFGVEIYTNVNKGAQRKANAGEIKQAEAIKQLEYYINREETSKHKMAVRPQDIKDRGPIVEIDLGPNPENRSRRIVKSMPKKEWNELQDILTERGATDLTAEDIKNFEQTSAPLRSSREGGIPAERKGWEGTGSQ